MRARRAARRAGGLAALLAAGAATAAASRGTTPPREAAGAAAGTSAQRGAPPAVRWRPATPVAGALVVLEVRAGHASAADAIAAVDGRLGDEPLHFERAADGAWIALGGLPIDARDTVRVPLVVHRVDGTRDTLAPALPVSAGDYRMERLSVAPRYGREPSAELQRRMAREAAQARAVSEGAHATPRLWSLPFERPRPGRVTSPFGSGRTFNGQVQSRHMGTDLAGAVGAPVRATNCGVVRLVADFHLAGRAVYVDHGAGLVSGYFHLSEPLVAEGDTVRRGEVIGRVGATGRVTGPHLHWILRSGTTTVDPTSALALDSLAPALADALGEPAQPCSAASTSSAAR